MKSLKNISLFLCFSVIAIAAKAWTVPQETLTYDIMYKWGVVNKKAGTVKIRTNTPANGRFTSQLTGATASWADHIYEVRDTLRGTIDATKLIPYQYEKIAHEGGDYVHDNISFTHSGSSTSAKVIHRKQKKKAIEPTITEKELHANGTTLDMLSAFYYMRNINYANMKKGQTVKLHVFSGSQAEILTIHYEGTEEIEIQKKKIPTYHITFTFTSKAGKKTSDNMDAWLSTTPTRIPLLMEGKLPVGKVRALYSGPIPN